MAQGKQILNQGESPNVVLKKFEGLSLKLDLVNRAKESFQQLDNFDLYVPGSIRKVLPSVLYGGPYGANIYNCAEYLAQANNPNNPGGIRRLIGVGADGKLYDLASATPTVPYSDTSALLGTPFTIPIILQYPGFFIPYNIRSWQLNTAYALHDAVIEFGPDGNVYMFEVTTSGTSSNTVEPTWPITGTVADNTVIWTNRGIPNSSRFFVYFLAIISPGKQPIRIVEWQYDPTSVIETPKITTGVMGVSPAQVPPQVTGSIINPNLNGYAPAAGRAYQWAFYNPQTLQEGSPSPFVGKTKIVETDNSNRTVSINGSILLPLPQPNETSAIQLPQRQLAKLVPFQSYHIFYVAIPIAALTPPIGSNYTHIRIYATKDGSSVFFLVPTLFDDVGNQITNSDGSIPIALLTSLQAARGWTDYFPLPEPQAVAASGRCYEGSGPINLAPDPINLGPAAWFATIGKEAMYVAQNTAPDGANAIQLEGPNVNKNKYRSTSISVTNQQYYFQMFLDKTNGAGGTMSVAIIANNGTNILNKVQADNTASTLSGTFTPTAGQKQIQIEVFANGITITADTFLLWSNPVINVGSALNATPANEPTPDNSLLIPAPLAFSNNPPPIARTAELYKDAIFFVDHTDPSKILYTQQGSYEKVALTNFVRSSTLKGLTVMELVRVFDTLLVCKERSIEQITTYPPGQPVPVDPQHGVQAYRSSVPFGVALFSLMEHGLGQLSLASSISEGRAIDASFEAILVGDDIKPIIDSIDRNELHAQNLVTGLPSPAVLNKNNLYLLAFRKTG